ncbi:hypothetical protein FOZ60_010837 [Perkinsus olseni]|uniref:Uncharacterized protein n=1 Tax=Perkinsus olseni TaxID=32597 RepID=A0A7J6NE96_PEROL|nr:hypothetical protein FOZ60_010837 [Perkinsus olseni]
MLFPAHVEALRLEMVERVWKESTVVGPLPELMCDIMAYIPKPALTLDCPMEEIILRGHRKFIFIRSAVVYGVFSGIYREIYLEQLSPPGKRWDIGRTPYPNYSSYNVICHFDADTSHLYVLHDSGSTFTDNVVHGTAKLVVFNVKAGVIDKTVNFDNLGEFPRALTSLADYVLFGVECRGTASGTSIELLAGDLDGRVTAVWRIAGTDAKLVGLRPVTASPMTLDVIYTESSACHSVRLEMSTGDLLLSEEKYKSRIATSQYSPCLFGGGILMVGPPSSFSIFDSRLRLISSGQSIPHQATCHGLQTDR